MACPEWVTLKWDLGGERSLLKKSISPGQVLPNFFHFSFWRSEYNFHDQNYITIRDILKDGLAAVWMLTSVFCLTTLDNFPCLSSFLFTPFTPLTSSFPLLSFVFQCSVRCTPNTFPEFLRPTLPIISILRLICFVFGRSSERCWFTDDKTSRVTPSYTN